MYMIVQCQVHVFIKSIKLTYTSLLFPSPFLDSFDLEPNVKNKVENSCYTYEKKNNIFTGHLVFLLNILMVN